MAKQENKAEHGISWKKKNEENEPNGKPRKKYLVGI